MNLNPNYNINELIVVSYDEYVKANSFEQVQGFIKKCKGEIKQQLTLINNKQLIFLPLLIIFCKTDDETRDALYCYLEDVCKCKPYEWEKLYNIVLI